MTSTELLNTPHRGAVLDDAHIGDIRGAFGTIRHGDEAPRHGWRATVDAARNPWAWSNRYGRRQ